MSEAVKLESIREVLNRRPAPDNHREQLFWLVDLVYSCKSSENPDLVRQAGLVEEALGALGRYIESGDKQALIDARDCVASFAKRINEVVGEEDNAE